MPRGHATGIDCLKDHFRPALKLVGVGDVEGANFARSMALGAVFVEDRGDGVCVAYRWRRWFVRRTGFG